MDSNRTNYSDGVTAHMAQKRDGEREASLGYLSIGPKKQHSLTVVCVNRI